MIVVNKTSKMKSTVDWCENNYVHSDYVAELWNTLSGVSIFISAYLFRRMNPDVFEFYHFHHLSRVYRYLIIMSIGTILFHATLWFPFQLLDELSMVFICMKYLTLLRRMQTTKRSIPSDVLFRYDRHKKVGYVCVSLIPLAYFVHPYVQQILFHILLKVFEIYIVYFLYKLSQKVNKIVFQSLYKKVHDVMNFQMRVISSQVSVEKIKSNSLIKMQDEIQQFFEIKRSLSMYFKFGAGLYVMSISIWCLENLFCHHLEWIKLHAVWHVLSSYGIFYLNMIMKVHIQINELVDVGL